MHLCVPRADALDQDEEGCCSACCSIVLKIVSAFLIIITFPFSLAFCFKVSKLITCVYNDVHVVWSGVGLLLSLLGLCQKIAPHRHVFFSLAVNCATLHSCVACIPSVVSFLGFRTVSKSQFSCMQEWLQISPPPPTHTHTIHIHTKSCLVYTHPADLSRRYTTTRSRQRSFQRYPGPGPIPRPCTCSYALYPGTGPAPIPCPLLVIYPGLDPIPLALVLYPPPPPAPLLLVLVLTSSRRIV